MARIGIDLGGTNIVAGVVDDGYHILAKAKRKTAVPRPAEQIVDDMAACAREAVETAGLTMDRIEAVGVGSPGVCNGQTGVVERADNLGFSHVPLREMLGARLRKPIGLENDANAAAYAEYLAGAAQGKKSYPKNSDGKKKTTQKSQSKGKNYTRKPSQNQKGKRRTKKNNTPIHAADRTP